MIWVAVAAAGLAVGAWVQTQRQQRAVMEAHRLAQRVGEQVRRAREAAARGETARAAEELSAARHALERAHGGTAQAIYATVLVELAALRSSLHGDPRGALGLLEQAWEVPDLPAPLRARIARDAGALSVLAGDLEGARQWYARALEVEPGDPEAASRLRALELAEGDRSP